MSPTGQPGSQATIAPAGGRIRPETNGGTPPGKAAGPTKMPPRRTLLWFLIIHSTHRGPPQTAKSFATTLPAFVDPGLEKFLIDNHVEISARPTEEERNPLLTVLLGFGPALLLIGLYVWMFRRAARQGGGIGGLMGIGKSRARRYDATTDERVTFDDVAGIDDAENELVEILEVTGLPPAPSLQNQALPALSADGDAAGTA